MNGAEDNGAGVNGAQENAGGLQVNGAQANGGGLQINGAGGNDAEANGLQEHGGALQLNGAGDNDAQANGGGLQINGAGGNNAHENGGGGQGGGAQANGVGGPGIVNRLNQALGNLQVGLQRIDLGLECLTLGVNLLETEPALTDNVDVNRPITRSVIRVSQESLVELRGRIQWWVDEILDGLQQHAHLFHVEVHEIQVACVIIGSCVLGIHGTLVHNEHSRDGQNGPFCIQQGLAHMNIGLAHIQRGIYRFRELEPPGFVWDDLADGGDMQQ